MWNTAGSAVYLGCQWLITVLAVRIFNDFVSVGYLSQAMNITNFFVIIAHYNMRAFQVSDTENEYNNGHFIGSRIITCVLSFALCWFFVSLVDFSPFQQAIILFYMLFRINEAFADVLYGINQKKWRMDYSGISSILKGCFFLAGFVVFGFIGGVFWSVIAMIITTIAITVIYDYQKTKSIDKLCLFFNKKTFLLLKVCFPLMIIQLISIFMSTFTRFSLERVYGTELLGYFAVAVAPAMIIQTAASFIFLPLVNVFISYLNEKNIKNFIRTYVGYVLIIAAITFIAYIVTLLIGEWGLVLLFGDSVRSYAYLLPIAVIVAGLTAIMWFSSLVLTVVRDIKGQLYGNILGAVICLVFTNVFLVNFGLSGANYIMLLSQGVAVCCFIIRLLLFFRMRHN